MWSEVLTPDPKSASLFTQREEVIAHRLGVAAGGTFTDLVLMTDVTGQVWQMKVPTTPHNPSEGVLEGIRRICEKAGVSLKDISLVLHGTTIATNALLEAKGARVGLITTKGFKQILHLARSQTPGPLAGWIIMVKPEPPAALEDTREVSERIASTGQVIEPLDEEEAKETLKELIDSGIEALTVALINSYINPIHEERLEEIARSLRPNLPVSLSSRILPEFREYERALTACMNAYVKPKMRYYLSDLTLSLRKLGFDGQLNIVRSDAGLMTSSFAADFPVYGILSGPAGGVAGAIEVARLAGFQDIMTFDMGGTSTDVSLCHEGRPSISRQTDVPYGLGLPGEVIPIRVPSVDVHSIGAGGGSIAYINEVTGALRVGPQSAGADPGPACYGKGGQHATVTDANVVVGHLPPRLLGGEIILDVDAAMRAIEPIAKALNKNLYEAAEGILEIVNENMAGALRVVSVQRGYDPRDFALVAFGGAGPMHANAVAEILGSFPVLVPQSPGLICAIGDLLADFRNEFAQTYIRQLERANLSEVMEIFESLTQKAADWLRSEISGSSPPELMYSVDMRYFRQGYEITLDINLDQLRKEGFSYLMLLFNEYHKKLYGFSLEEAKYEIVNLRVTGRARLPRPKMPEGDLEGENADHAVIGEQKIYFKGEWLDGLIYDRSKLKPGNALVGPAIVLEYDSTVVLRRGFRATVDKFFNLIIEPAEANA